MPFPKAQSIPHFCGMGFGAPEAVPQKKGRFRPKTALGVLGRGWMGTRRWLPLGAEAGDESIMLSGSFAPGFSRGRRGDCPLIVTMGASAPFPAAAAAQGLKPPQ